METHESSDISFGFFELSQRYFINSLCLAIRNSVDSRPEIISVKDILESMYVHNEFFTRDRSIEVTGNDELWLEKHMVDWRKYTDSENESYISKRIILGKIAELNRITEPVIKYTDKNITHFSRKKQSQEEEATFKNVWDASNYILNYYGRPYEAIPPYGYHEHLYIPWWKEDYKPKWPDENWGKEKFEQW